MWTGSVKLAAALVLVGIAAAVWLFLRVDVLEPVDPPPGPLGVEEAADRLDCADQHPIDAMDGPIRGGAAIAGIACTYRGDPVHLFEAARVGQSGHFQLDYRHLFGIRDDATGPIPAPCAARVLTGRDLIVVVGSLEVADDVTEALGGGFADREVTTTPASYELPCR